MGWPTLGGPYFWQDYRVRHDWRLQRRVGTERWRVLNPRDFRVAQGTRTRMGGFWREKVEPEIQAIEARAGKKPDKIVLFLHGIQEFKGFWALNVRDIRREAARQGLFVETCPLNYASACERVEYFADALAETVEALPPETPLVAVCHSMGGLVLNTYLKSRGRPATEGPHPFEAAIYLGTPFAGSPFADGLKNWFLYRWLFGPAGQQLITAPAHLADFPWPDCRTVCIAGSKPPKGYFPWDWVIPGDDDGVVSVASALPEQATERVTLRGYHVWQMMVRPARKKIVEVVFG
jgi:hypothetical protein